MNRMADLHPTSTPHIVGSARHRPLALCAAGLRDSGLRAGTAPKLPASPPRPMRQPHPRRYRRPDQAGPSTIRHERQAEHSCNSADASELQAKSLPAIPLADQGRARLRRTDAGGRLASCECDQHALVNLVEVIADVSASRATGSRHSLADHDAARIFIDIAVGRVRRPMTAFIAAWARRRLNVPPTAGPCSQRPRTRGWCGCLYLPLIFIVEALSTLAFAVASLRHFAPCACPTICAASPSPSSSRQIANHADGIEHR